MVDKRLFLKSRRAPWGARSEIKLISPVMLITLEAARVAIKKDDQADLRHIYAEQPPFLIIQREQEDLSVQQEHPNQTDQAQSDVSADGIQADAV